MKIEVNVDKKYFFSILGAILILGTLVGVFAYNAQFNGDTTSGWVAGHSADEINIKMDDGSIKTVQELLKGGIGSGWIDITSDTNSFDINNCEYSFVLTLNGKIERHFASRISSGFIQSDFSSNDYFDVNSSNKALASGNLGSFACTTFKRCNA